MPKIQDSIFDFINPNENDNISKMSKKELQHLLYLLEHYYLTLRKKLNIDNETTFGFELEFENADVNKIKTKLEKFNTQKENYENWIIKNDSSLIEGAEINSPVLTNKSTTWKDLNQVCNIAKKHANIKSYAGGHIHIGAHILGNDTNAWLNFIKLWSVYENIIFRFSYGEYLSPRNEIEEYAKPISKDLWKKYQKLKKYDNLIPPYLIQEISQGRRMAINFSNVRSSNIDRNITRNTIEFRCPNGTLNPVIWQNNLNLFNHLLTYSKNKLYNNEIINKRHDYIDNMYDELKDYNEIYLDQALELCDIVFNNNLDKLYFLRQYIKSFQTDSKLLSKAKEFTKIK